MTWQLEIEKPVFLTGVHSLLNGDQAMFNTSSKLDLFTTFLNQNNKISIYCALILYRLLCQPLINIFLYTPLTWYIYLILILTM